MVEERRRDDSRIRNEVREVVVLLQSRKANELVLARAGREPLDWDRVGNEHLAREAPRDLALQAGELVVLHLDRGDAPQRADDGQVDRSVGERDVEAPAAANGAGGTNARRPRAPSPTPAPA